MHVWLYLYHDSMSKPSPTKRGAHFTIPRLGKLLREARRSAGLSAQSVMEVSGLSIETVRSIESDRMASSMFTTVAQLASALEMSLNGLSEATQVDERDS